MAYDREIYEASQAYGIPEDVIKTVIDIESTWNPNAKREEPKINDASYGLMQVLYTTAKKLGYTGPPEGLFDPSTNINLGTKLLFQLWSKYHNWTDVIAAYNAGVARKNAQGQYINSKGSTIVQHHVDKFLAAWDKYKKKTMLAAAPPTIENPADLIQFPTMQFIKTATPPTPSSAFSPQVIPEIPAKKIPKTLIMAVVILIFANIILN